MMNGEIACLSEPGLVIVVAEDDNELQGAADILDKNRAPGESGLIIVSQDYAANHPGPIPDWLLERDIAIQPSHHQNLWKTAADALADYRRAVRFTNQASAEGMRYHLEDPDAEPDDRDQFTQARETDYQR